MGPSRSGFFTVWYRAVAAIQPDALRQVWWFKIPFALLELGVRAGRDCVCWLWPAKPCTWLLIYLWSPLDRCRVLGSGAQRHAGVGVRCGGCRRGALGPLEVGVSLARDGDSEQVLAGHSLSLLPAASRGRGAGFSAGKQALASLPLIALVVAPYWDGLRNVPELLEGVSGGLAKQ